MILVPVFNVAKYKVPTNFQSWKNLQKHFWSIKNSKKSYKSYKKSQKKIIIWALEIYRPDTFSLCFKQPRFLRWEVATHMSLFSTLLWECNKWIFECNLALSCLCQSNCFYFIPHAMNKFIPNPMLKFQIFLYQYVKPTIIYLWRLVKLLNVCTIIILNVVVQLKSMNW